MRGTTPFVSALVLFIGSEALLVYFGYVKLYLVLFIPVFVSTSPIAFAPLLFFIIPLLYPFFGFRKSKSNEYSEFSYQRADEHLEKGNTKFGGIVMIGPIPIVFGKGISGKVLAVLAIIMLILIIAWFVLSK